MNEPWVEVLRIALAAPFVTAAGLLIAGVRKDRHEGRVSEHDMLERMRGMLLADLEATKRDRDQLQERIERLEAATAADGRRIVALRAHIDYLGDYMSSRCPEGTMRPKPLPRWLREDDVAQ